MNDADDDADEDDGDSWQLNLGPSACELRTISA